MNKIILSVSLLFICAFLPTSIQSQPYVILISFDGFRWDYSERGITPNLDKMKMNGVHASSLKPVFPSKTFPNHYSMVTGMYPENHGLIGNNFVDPFLNKRYRVGDTISVRESKWYLGEAFWQTAKRNGIKSASYFWPGSEVEIDYMRPDLYEKYEHYRPYKKRVHDVIKWLSLPHIQRPHFITLYFDDTDTYGHKYGPISPEINQSIQRLDSIMGYLNSELLQLEIKDSVNIILVSDHGMTEINTERIINIDEIISEFDYKLEGDKSFVEITTSKNNINSVYLKLKANQNHYKVYLKTELPNYYHFSNHPFISPIILIADLGWSIVNNETIKYFRKSYSKGNHGYDNNHLDMHGTFIASGPHFKSNLKTGTINNIDIYPLLSKIFNIYPRSNIDGKLERIEFILK